MSVPAKLDQPSRKKTPQGHLQSDRSAFRSNGTLKAKSSTVTVFKSMCCRRQLSSVNGLV